MPLCRCLLDYLLLYQISYLFGSPLKFRWSLEFIKVIQLKFLIVEYQNYYFPVINLKPSAVLFQKD